jgi:hypothetical protein
MHLIVIIALLVSYVAFVIVLFVILMDLGLMLAGFPLPILRVHCAHCGEFFGFYVLSQAVLWWWYHPDECDHGECGE